MPHPSGSPQEWDVEAPRLGCRAQRKPGRPASRTRIPAGGFIPADSAKLIIHNHFLPGNRYGYPGHLPEFGGLGGFEVNFLPEYKALHDAGYNILAYDIRNHGLSGQGNGGIAAIGLLEYRDVIGSVRYAASRPDTKNMKKVLLSVCLGADSTAVAWSKRPDEFFQIQAMIMLPPVSGRYVVEEFVKGIGMPNGHEKFDKAVHERTGFHLAEQSPLEHVKAVTVPTLVAQVHHDTMTRPEDVQSIYDALRVKDKELHWIEGTTRRFDGYNYFGVHPEIPIEWFNKHSSDPTPQP